MSLPIEISLAINTLLRGCEGIDTVMNATPGNNRFTVALESLQRLAIEKQIPIAIVGELGAIRYGYPAATQDIDIALQKDHLSCFLAAAPNFGFIVVWESKTGWHTLMHGDVEINIIPEGGRAKDTSPTTIPGPTQMGVNQGIQYASIESWVELKISAGRQKDIAHIVEVLKKSDAESIGRIEQHLRRVHESYYQKFQLLKAEAIEESGQEDKRR